ncbi:MAG: hypothetical protein OEW00_05785 [candidate division Zixibacteria bacterium]|nr:hypothetical protein [candidate division Zixibacteria bacterium]
MSVRLFGLIVLSYVCISYGPRQTYAFEPSIEDAQELLNEFHAAVVRDDSLTIKRLFSHVSASQDGFWESMHIGIGNLGTLSALREFALAHEPVVDKIESKDNYAIAHFNWIPGDSMPESSSSPVSMRYYLVEEHSQVLLINPIDVLTQDWLHHSGKVCTFHYSPRAADGDEFFAMQRMDSLCTELLKLFDSSLEFNTDVYVTPDGRECGELILYPPAGGYACAPRNLIVTTTFINPHELVHLLSTDNLSLFINAAFAEGMAVGLGGTYFSLPEYATAQSRNVAAGELYIPIGELLFMDNQSFLANSQVTYQEAGSFVRFLIDRFGLLKLRTLEDCSKQTDNLKSCIEATFSATVEELERQWLGHINATAISLSDSGDGQTSAESVISISDPSGDDHGGGGYSYPTDTRFVAGGLDITRFEVRADQETVYFRIEFAELGRPVVDESTGHKIVPGVAVGIRRADGHLQKQYQGIRFAEGNGIDLRIEVGLSIVVYDSYGQAFFSSGSIRDSISNYPTNSILFTMPIKLIGKPTSRWEWFVGSMLVTDFSFGFLRSFPCPVQSGQSEFRVGGSGSPTASPFVDLVLPEGIDQADLFNEYDPHRGKPLVVPLNCSVHK